MGPWCRERAPAAMLRRQRGFVRASFPRDTVARDNAAKYSRLRAATLPTSMNSFSIVLLSVSLSAAGATIVSLALRTSPDVSPVDAAGVAELQRAVGELRAANTALQGRLEALATMPASSAVPSNDRVAAPAISNEQIA